MTVAARLEAVVRGRVTGVGFRMYVADTARQLRLVGWVANEASGTVHCVAEGPREDLERLLAALRTGPRGAVVDRVDETFSASTDAFRRFEIRSGWHPGD
ncbi:MAG TPA: acylphosphatase [Candidatus Dormibacteraeota bacterium]|nr:acylphosphatase [Candidatus Dormibacteraeota bacterium]